MPLSQMGLSKCITAYCARTSLAALLLKTIFRHPGEVGMATGKACVRSVCITRLLLAVIIKRKC